MRRCRQARTPSSSLCPAAYVSGVFIVRYQGAAGADVIEATRLRPQPTPYLLLPRGIVERTARGCGRVWTIYRPARRVWSGFLHPTIPELRAGLLPPTILGSSELFAYLIAKNPRHIPAVVIGVVSIRGDDIGEFHGPSF